MVTGANLIYTEYQVKQKTEYMLVGNKPQHTACPDLLLSELCVYEICAFILSSVK